MAYSANDVIEERLSIGQARAADQEKLRESGPG
jgi:hypothetical protein